MRSALADEVIRALWSLWTELGVMGPERRHTSNWIDVERTILLTDHFARDDQRLLEEARGWVAANRRLLSATRAKHLGIDLDAFAGASRREREPLRSVGEAGRAQLRLRAAVGVSHRAEVLGVLRHATIARVPVRTADLAREVGATERSIAYTLEHLRLARLVITADQDGSARHTLTPAGLETLAAIPGAWPARQTWWAPLTDVLLAFDAAIAALCQQPKELHLISIHEFQDRWTGDMRLIRGFSPSSTFEPDERVAARFAQWVVDEARIALANLG